MIITITGTPGTGKTYLAREMKKKFKIGYLDLNKYIKDNKIYQNYDRKNRCYVVDEKKLSGRISKKKLGKILQKFHKDGLHFMKNTARKFIGKSLARQEFLFLLERHQDALKNSIIVDSHLSQYIDSDLCLVVKTDIKNIFSRLKKRGYPLKKIHDNIESEIFDSCLEDAKSLKRKIIIINN